jgi:hypothetical protein
MDSEIEINGETYIKKSDIEAEEPSNVDDNGNRDNVDCEEKESPLFTFLIFTFFIIAFLIIGIFFGVICGLIL